MIFHNCPLTSVYTIELEKREDYRGFFAHTFCIDEFRSRGLAYNIVQINNSLSTDRGTLRGMHYQLPPHAETKIVRCIRGSLWDCVLDLRERSPTFGQWFGAELSGDNRRMMYVPKGCAHGFITLEDQTEAFYIVDEVYAPRQERGVRYNDLRFSIQWPIVPICISEKDQGHPDFDRDYHLRVGRSL